MSARRVKTCPREPARRGRPVTFALTVGISVVLAMASPVTAQNTAPNGAASPSRTGQDNRPEVRKVVLENGLRLLLLSRDGAPTVSFVMQYAIGGIHEQPGETGVAHLLEHMLFKGSETIGTTDIEAERRLFETMDRLHENALAASGDPEQVQRIRSEIDRLEDEARELVVSNEFDRILSRAGAQGLNATTTSESTTYFVELPANRTELFFALEADRMANPVFREFYSERDVVMEERRMRVDASPAGTLYERHLSAAFTEHPYGQPVVGYMADLERLGRQDVARYYRDYYGPNNAVLAVVGRFDPAKVEDWARSYLGPIPRGLEPPRVDASEPSQIMERRVVVEWDAESSLRIGWHVPNARHDDAAALAMLSAILTGGRTSRLHRRLVTHDQIAASIYSYTGPGSRFPQLFQIDVTPVQTTSTDAIERAVYDEIRRMQKGGPMADEIERVRNQIAAGTVRRLQSSLGLAFQIADSESLFGDWRATFDASDRFRGVTQEDVRDVARRYLTPENRTVAVLRRPEPSR